MTSPVDPRALPRPPLNLAIAVDTSGSMAGEKLEFARRGLLRMLEALEPEDAVTLVGYDDAARLLVEAAPGDLSTLSAAISALRAGGGTNVYDGLRLAFEAVARRGAELASPRQDRVILLSDGLATAGITSDEHLVALARAHARGGIGLTTIGVGSDFHVSLMRTLAEVGSGSFYFLEDARAVEEVFAEEVRAFLVPLATDVEIDIEPGPGYELRAIYGTRLGVVENGSRGRVAIPALFAAHRESAADAKLGRRGGGGGILVELLPVPGAADPGARWADGVDPYAVGKLTFTYRVPGTDLLREQTVAVRSPLLPGDDARRGYFEDATVEKGFVMLNLFVGFEMAAARIGRADLAGALAVLEPLGGAVQGWLERRPDPDIADDLRLLLTLADNLRRSGAEVPPSARTPEPWPRD
jgi:Ca-activated chloride channel family protein